MERRMASSLNRFRSQAVHLSDEVRSQHLVDQSMNLGPNITGITPRQVTPSSIVVTSPLIKPLRPTLLGVRRILVFEAQQRSPS
jgi:hypothetical protein